MKSNKGFDNSDRYFYAVGNENRYIVYKQNNCFVGGLSSEAN